LEKLFLQRLDFQYILFAKQLLCSHQTGQPSVAVEQGWSCWWGKEKWSWFSHYLKKSPTLYHSMYTHVIKPMKYRPSVANLSKKIICSVCSSPIWVCQKFDNGEFLCNENLWVKLKKGELCSWKWPLCSCSYLIGYCFLNPSCLLYSRTTVKLY
jgi:hypothetical protein